MRGQLTNPQFTLPRSSVPSSTCAPSRDDSRRGGAALSAIYFSHISGCVASAGRVSRVAHHGEGACHPTDERLPHKDAKPAGLQGAEEPPPAPRVPVLLRGLHQRLLSLLNLLLWATTTREGKDGSGGVQVPWTTADTSTVTFVGARLDGGMVVLVQEVGEAFQGGNQKHEGSEH